MPPIDHLHAIILAGGSGTRFWPLSRELSPKQMLTVFGGTSLVTQAVERIAPYTRPGNIALLTSEQLQGELRDHLSGVESARAAGVKIVAEPSPRNTAAAIALAAAYARVDDPDAIIAVLPSDHLLDDGDAWERALIAAAGAAEAGWIVTLGLVPSAPETGYGYIRPGDALDGAPGAKRVDRFLEKPDRQTAETLIAEGCLWNSGMVVARADVVLAELALAGSRATTADSAHGSEIAAAATELGALAPERWTERGVRERYDALPAVQFDRAVLEVSEKVAVVPTRLDWNDVGSLLALECLAEADERGNVLVGRTFDVDSAGVIAYSADRLLATLGLEDVLVVDTADATLVAAKDRAQDVRLIVDALKAARAPEVVTSRTSLRPWGSWTLLLKMPGFQVKTIVVEPGRRLSLQSHVKRSEHWIVVEGRARIERDGEAVVCGADESVDIPIGAKHRLENVGENALRIIEVALGEYLGEDDIVRYDDDWQRTSR